MLCSVYSAMQADGTIDDDKGGVGKEDTSCTSMLFLEHFPNILFLCIKKVSFSI